MARRLRNTDHGAYRVVARLEYPDDCKDLEFSEGPYATEAAAKARRTWIRSRFNWHLDRGALLYTELQEVKDPTWVPVAEELAL